MSETAIRHKNNIYALLAVGSFALRVSTEWLYQSGIQKAEIISALDLEEHDGGTWRLPFEETSDGTSINLAATKDLILKHDIKYILAPGIEGRANPVNLNHLDDWTHRVKSWPHPYREFSISGGSIKDITLLKVKREMLLQLDLEKVEIRP